MELLKLKSKPISKDVDVICYCECNLKILKGKPISLHESKPNHGF
jgi:hypothetical protein